MPQHHALLIGIDAYDGDGSLSGCVNDIDAVQRVLLERVGIGPERITRLASPLFEAEYDRTIAHTLPTLANIRAALEQLAGADREDRVFIYYSGHGTQCIVDDGQRRFTREALLPKDKVAGPRRRFLFDWELNELLGRIRARTTVVLDCCSSAGVTRSAAVPAGGQDRFHATTEPVVVDARPTRLRGLSRAIVDADCFVVAACHDDQRAREASRDNRTHGELTRALVDRLSSIPIAEIPTLTWGRIWRTIEGAVQRANPSQHPWLSGGFGRRLFGFGADEDGDAGFAIVQVPGGFELDVGELHGVVQGSRIAVYGPTPPTFPALTSDAERDARVGTLRVTVPGISTCTAIAEAPFRLPEAPRGRLVDAGTARLRVRVASEPPIPLASPLLQVVGERPDVTFERRGDGAWVLTDDVHGIADPDPVLIALPPDRLDRAVHVLEHYRTYTAPIRVARAARDLPKQLQLWVLDCNSWVLDPAKAQNPDLHPVEPRAGVPYEVVVGDKVCFVVANTSETALNVTLLDCAASGRVQLLGEKLPLAPRSQHVFWLKNRLGEPFVAGLSPPKRIGVDRLVVIGTTGNRSQRHLTTGTAFADLLDARRGVEASRGAASLELWTSTMTTIRIRR